jgi:alpha-methylacyl-CoA racemase
MDEAPHHPHMTARKTFVAIEDVVQPAPAPRFGRTPGRIGAPPASPGEHTESALADWGIAAEEIAALKAAGAIGRR